ncbi:MAG: RelA/SpoT family protein [Bacteroidales bacterium]|nr:RelA/SpoT family protein [Bacteroidales bacterium]
MKTTEKQEKIVVPITPEEEAFIQNEFQGLLDDYAHTRKGDKADRIKQVFEFAKKAHGNDRRKNGTPYIIHPLAVARIVAHEVGMGSTSISAALLHDVVKDTDVTFEEVKDTFGERICNLVRGLTKISGGNVRFVTDETSDDQHRGIKNPEEQAENFRNLLLTMSEDVRVIIVKIADRLHNMRTLSALPPLKQKRIANETLYLYAPLAYRLGLYTIKTELEDLSLKYEHPEEYEDLKQKLKDSQENRDRLFKTFSAPIEGLLDDLGLKYTLKMRMKSIYSIWNKMQKKHVPFEEVYDLYAARIVFQPQTPASEKTDCWRIYTAITSIYKLHPDRIRDWISHPKGNGYEALHVTVMGPDGNWIEIQIRTQRMDEIAERGLAMHWKYKRGEANEANKDLDKWVKDIKDILDDPAPNALDFLDTIKLNLLSSEIYVFTPAGDLKELPKGATALDFAFALHTQVGFHAEAARINHELVPLSTKLDSGQQVEIITSETETCQVSWAAFVTTSKARSAVRSYLTKHFPKEMEEIAKKLEKEQKTSKTQQLLGWLHLSKPKAKKEKPRTEVFKPKVSSTTLELSGIDGRGLLNTITKAIADNCTANITNIQLNCHDGLFDGSITLDTNDSKAVSRLCAALKKIHEVEKAARQ